MDVPPNETSELIASIFNFVTGLLSSYGWTLLFILIVANLLWIHFKPKYKNWRDSHESERLKEKYMQDPALVLDREEKLLISRQKLQEQHEKLVKAHQQKLKEQEEIKRKEKIENWERLQKGMSQISRTRSQSLQNHDYNPLAPSGSNCSYKPSRHNQNRRGG